MNSNLKLWIVDDEQGMRMGTERALRDYTVELADLDTTVSFSTESMESGEEFLEKLKTEKPKILLLDGKLPGIDGIEILEVLHRNKTSILTIMITAYATLEKAVKATKLGAYDFLAKPFTPSELRYAISKATRDIVLTERAAKLELEKKQVRFEFISVLAHELKSPLNAIDGYNEMVKTRQAGDLLTDYDSMFNRIGIRISGMRKLIADLLDLTSIESGKKKRELEEIDLCEITKTIVENNSEDAEKRKITINCNLPENAPVTADRGEMEMLFNNFITNGIKYNKEEGDLTITLLSKANNYEISFSDTGIGMSDEEQRRLFKEFSRIKNKKTRTIQGSGLGLSIIHKILKQYKGAVTVKSKPDKGSIFTIQIPYHKDATVNP